MHRSRQEFHEYLHCCALLMHRGHQTINSAGSRSSQLRNSSFLQRGIADVQWWKARILKQTVKYSQNNYFLSSTFSNREFAWVMTYNSLSYGINVWPGQLANNIGAFKSRGMGRCLSPENPATSMAKNLQEQPLLYSTAAILGHVWMKHLSRRKQTEARG
jgi:hypothetical protein